MRRFRQLVAACGIVAWLAGCGPSRPPAQTANEARQQPAPAAAQVQQPAKRDLNAEARSSFADAAQAYEQAKKDGALEASECEALSERFESLYQEHGKLIEAKFNQGAVWHECGKLELAERIYQEVLAKQPSYGPALNNLGQIAFARGRQADGVELFRRAAASKSSEGYANVAMLQRIEALSGSSAALKEAIDNIHRALAVDSFNIEAYGLLATLVYDHAKDKSQLEIARLICVQAIKQQPSYAPAYNVLGLVLLRMGEVTRALAQFRKAVELDPKFIEAQMNIGGITLGFRDYNSAEAAFSAVLALQPDKATAFDATIGLGVAYRGQKRFEEAMQRYQQAEKLDPANASVPYNMGILLQDYLFDAGDPGKGIEQLRQARALLQRFASSDAPLEKRRDAERRIKNIDEIIPMLIDQQKISSQVEAGGASAQ